MVLAVRHYVGVGLGVHARQVVAKKISKQTIGSTLTTSMNEFMRDGFVKIGRIERICSEKDNGLARSIISKSLRRRRITCSIYSNPVRKRPALGPECLAQDSVIGGASQRVC
jgi:hypothetical protein